MKWFRLLTFTLSISLSAASIDLGLAGSAEILREYRNSVSRRVTLPQLNHLSLPYQYHLNDSSMPSQILSDPKYLDLSISTPMLERCFACGTQSLGYHRSSDGKWQLDRGCHWVRPNDNSDLRTYCD